MKELFELTADNRAFLAARLYSGDTDGSGLGTSVAIPYLKRIHDAFYDKGGWPRSNLRLADARKAIRDYRKATSDSAGTMNLMIAYVETGTEYSLDFGAEEDSLFDSLSSVLNEIESACAERQGRVLYDHFRQRLQGLAEKARGIGWGYGDHVVYIVERLGERWSNES